MYNSYQTPSPSQWQSEQKNYNPTPSTSYPMAQPPNSMTRSRIMEQNRYLPNEQLYNPLKNAVSADPYTIQMRN